VLRRFAIFSVLSWVLAAAWPAYSVPIFNGVGDGAIVFGVSPVANVVPGVPTYIPNNINGISDVLTSPGGTFKTASPVVANNIQEIPVPPPATLPLPVVGFQIGGGNGNGPFGSGSVAVTGPQVFFSLQDVAAGGSTSYSITHWSANFTETVGGLQNIGSFLSIGGTLPAVDSAAVAALRTHLSSLNPLSPFFNGGLGIDLPQLVLANGRIAPLTYSFVALGGAGAAMLVDDAAVGTFRGLAINNLAFNIPLGDVIVAENTLTVYADPSQLGDIAPAADLISMTGTTLPTNSLLFVPEPGISLLGALGALGLVLRPGVRRRRRSAHAR